VYEVYTKDLKKKKNSIFLSTSQLLYTNVSMTARLLSSELKQAAVAISKARALYVTAGAGMGVDSGLPDFRGPEGFWKAYPPLKSLGVRFPDMSNPKWFDSDPELAWGYYGHRYHLYCTTIPHDGFQILRQWGKHMDHGYFVFTSNVDGQFQKAGFAEDFIVECHGSIHFHQCIHDDGRIWPVPENFHLDVDMSTLRATSPLPKGPPGVNDTLARPNILMFGDYDWVGDRTELQYTRMREFRNRTLKDNFVVIEIGAGHAVPTVRLTSEHLVAGCPGTLIRINKTDPEVPRGHISLPIGGKEALTLIQELLSHIK